MDDAGATPPDDADLDELDLDDDDYEEADEEPETTGRGKGSRTPRPPGPIDRRIANVAQHVANLKGWSYQDLADRIVPAHQGETWNKPRVQRFLNARKRVTITELADIVRALDVPLTWFYKEAGVIVVPDDTAGWIEADTSISAEARRALLRQYRLEQQAHKATNGS
jgi:hypothetical protein